VDKLKPFQTYNLQGSISGPIPLTDNKVTLFANVRRLDDDGYIFGRRDYLPSGARGDSSLVPMNWSKQWIGQANLSYYASSKLKFNVEMLYSNDDYRNYNHAFRLIRTAMLLINNSYNATFTMTHTFSNTSFYTLKASYFSREL